MTPVSDRTPSHRTPANPPRRAVDRSPGSFALGRIAGIPFFVHWSVLVIAVVAGANLGEVYGGLTAALAVVAFLASIVAHEVGHALVARHHGVRTSSIQLWALGGVARLEREAPNARAEGWIAAAGPLTSLAIGAASIGGAVTLAEVLDHRGDLTMVLAWLGGINVLLALFNLLPGAPLDGGRILKAWRWGRHRDRIRAIREAANAGQAIGWSLIGISVVMLINGMSGFWLLVTGGFIVLNARAELVSADVAERVQGMRVRELTWFGIAHASADTDADTMLWQRSRLGGAGIVAVEHADGQLAGVVSEEQLLAVPEWRRATVSLASLMVPMQQVAHAQLDEDLSMVISRLTPSAPFITVWREGRLLGVVPGRRLNAALRRP